MTSKEPSKRWNNGNGYQRHPKMWKDIQNSDWNTDWVHEILCENVSNREEAEYLESLFISWFDSINKGYNISSYGSGHFKKSDRTKKKISEARIGITFSEEHKRKIRENNPSKAVIQLSKDGKFIAEYPSIMEAERQTGCHYQSICACCKGRLKSAGGFIWKYKEI